MGNSVIIVRCSSPPIEHRDYFVVDVDRLAAQRPALHHQMRPKVVAMFDAASCSARNHRVSIASLSDAMKFMTRAATGARSS